MTWLASREDLQHHRGVPSGARIFPSSASCRPWASCTAGTLGSAAVCYGRVRRCCSDDFRESDAVRARMRISGAIRGRFSAIWNCCRPSARISSSYPWCVRDLPGRFRRKNRNRRGHQAFGRRNPAGAFAGFAMVAAKLFSITQPTRAYFGRKDAQQCVVVQNNGARSWLPLQSGDLSHGVGGG